MKGANIASDILHLLFCITADVDKYILNTLNNTGVNNEYIMKIDPGVNIPYDSRLEINSQCRKSLLIQPV
jgi:hypothetical protein